MAGDPEDLVGPVDSILEQVPDPKPHSIDAKGHAEHLLASSQGLTGTSPFLGQLALGFSKEQLLLQLTVPQLGALQG